MGRIVYGVLYTIYTCQGRGVVAYHLLAMLPGWWMFFDSGSDTRGMLPSEGSQDGNIYYDE